ncbi:hypothetical protein [Vallicoccus soli]|uniref:Uncharacterized protein n=1 Tax=Vallicoccus soli TaxID=2339232 RepID=A0A3A3YZ76_9ACTN|nr:hypothetical protein [Vallicoccus soli]RJK97050.1 hypothetical protein D5H78_07455 [Vallicoccus soli]
MAEQQDGGSGRPRRGGLRGLVDRALLTVWGPPDLDPSVRRRSPLEGTEWDPQVRKARRAERRRRG